MKKDLQNYLNAILMSLLDCLFLNIAVWFSCVFFTYLLKYDSQVLLIYYQCMPAMTAICFLIFLGMGVHKTLWTYLSLRDLLRIVAAVFFASFFAYATMKLVTGAWQNPILAVTTFYLFLTLSAGIRILPSLWRLFLRRLQREASQGKVPLLIVGAGEAADALIKDINDAGKPSKYYIAGLTDDDDKKQGHALRGVNILGSTADIPHIVKQYGIQEIVIAAPSSTTAQRQKMMAATMATGCRVLSMSRVSHLSAPNVADLHDLDIGDLLGRQEVFLNPDVMATYITGNVVLVTGGGGSIGSELCRQLLRFGPSALVIFDIYENNAYNLLQELRIVYRGRLENVHVRIGSVQDRERLDAVFSEFRPAVVFHAAAYKHVPLMEECPPMAIENNVFGTYNTARAAVQHEVRRFVMISTDKAVNPTNIMGASKRLAELTIQSMNGEGTEFVAVRFGNVLGSNGSVVPIFRRQIETGGPVTITHPDIIRYFMTIPEAARLVLQAGAMAKGGETFVLDMGEPVKILDLAHTMIEMAGLTPEKDIEILYTGLRPGEKLYEELLLGGEGTEKTENDKIFIAHSDVISNKERRDMLDELHRCIKKREDVREYIRKYVPGYHEEEETADRPDSVPNL